MGSFVNSLGRRSHSPAAHRLAIGLVILTVAGLLVGVGAATHDAHANPNHVAVGAPAPGPSAAASPAQATQADTVPSAETTVSVRGGPDRIRYELRVRSPAEVDNVHVVVDRTAVVSATGFDRTVSEGSEGSLQRFVATGDGPSTVVLDVTSPVVESTGDAESSSERLDQTVTRIPFAEVQTVVGDRVRRDRPLGDGSLDGETETGRFGRRYAIAGPTDSATRVAGDRSVTVVAPAGASRRDPEAVAAALLAAGDRLDVGDRDDHVLAFVAPDAAAVGEAVPEADEFWVGSGAQLADPENVWVHEYVHTRQTLELAPDMRWFREASAEYYAARVSADLGWIPDRAVRSSFAGQPTDARLTDPGTWDDAGVPRRRGASALAVLDRRIARATDGERSLAAVFRRLNAHDGPVTYRDFRRAVGQVAPGTESGWLDRHVAGSESIVTGGSGVAAATGPTGPHPRRPTPESFVRVSLALSLVAATPLYRILQRLQPADPPIAGSVPR